MKTPTIYEIKRLTAETSPQFFSRQALKFFKQTMKSFRVTKAPGGKFLIRAEIGNLFPDLARYHKKEYTLRIFDPSTNKLERIKEPLK
jgi:hypothetical protein